MDSLDIKIMVRNCYGSIAAADAANWGAAAASCCVPTALADAAGKARATCYSDADLTAISEGANLRLGWGNPQAPSVGTRSE